MIDESLPGADLIERGLRDLAVRRVSVESLLVSAGALRLRAGGIEVPEPTFPDAEHALYLLLEAEDADGAHSRYNALMRRLVSFEHALECVS